MLRSVGLEVMESSNGELSWKSVTKGRRSKKSVVRSLNSIVKLGSSIGPKRVGDISGSDSDKLSEVIPGQETSGKSDNVPLKKRRHLLESPSHHPWASSLHKQDSAPLKTLSSSPLLEDNVQLQYPSYSAGDFFGIELLAAAASMDDVIDDADKKDVLPEDSSVQKNSDASSSATLSKQCLKHNESVDSLSNMNLPGGNVDSQEDNSYALQSSSASPEDEMVLKVDRKHWDLNTSMDAWGEPYYDSISGDASKDVNVCSHMEMEEHFGDHVSSIQISVADGKPNLEIEQDKPISAGEDGICSEPPHLKGYLLDTPTNIYSHIVSESSNQACQKDPDDKNLNKVLTCDADSKRSNQVTSLDATVSISPLCCSSGMIKSEEKNNSISATVATIQQGDCSSSVSERERTAAVNGSHTRTDDVNAHDTAASKSAINVKPENEEVYQKISSPGTSTADDQPVASTDSNKQTDGAFLSNSTMADCKQYLKLAELGTRHDEDCILPNGNSKITVSIDTCKSSSSGAQCDEPNIVEGTGLPVDGQRTSSNDAGMVNGDDFTGFQEGYDSPYEDGELRGSFLDSWEDSGMDNNFVDYESDGINGNVSDAADYNGSEIVEGGFEGSNGSRGSLSLKRSPEGNSKSENVKHALKKHVVKAESDNNDMAGKGSNAGSGSTVEQCVEMRMEENDGIRRLELLDHKIAVDVRATRVDKYASKPVKGKLQSRIEGRSSAEATDRKDAFFIQQSRSRRFAGSYPRPERDISPSPDRYQGRYRSAAYDVRDGVHQWTSWVSRKDYTTNYQVGEDRSNRKPRIKIGESANRIDEVGYHDPRQTSYMSKGFNRPFMRRSPGERDDYFGVGRRRIQPTQGMGNYRSRGHYSEHSGRDFEEDFEPLPDASVRMPRYVSRREHSFSPGPDRPSHMILTRRRSRSRSRTRSPPRSWQNPHREQILERRRLNRCSPEFRTDSRMVRRKMPHPKAVFASDYGEGYISTSRGQLSPQRNCRWVEDDDFADNHARRRRVLRRFDGVGSSFFSSRLKAGEYPRHVIRPGRRMSFKVESNYDDRRRDDGGGEMNHRLVDGKVRRFRGSDDLETKNMDDEDDDFEREDKKAYKI